MENVICFVYFFISKFETEYSGQYNVVRINTITIVNNLGFKRFWVFNNGNYD